MDDGINLTFKGVILVCVGHGHHLVLSLLVSPAEQVQDQPSTEDDDHTQTAVYKYAGDLATESTKKQLAR